MRVLLFSDSVRQVDDLITSTESSDATSTPGDGAFLDKISIAMENFMDRFVDESSRMPSVFRKKLFELLDEVFQAADEYITAIKDYIDSLPSENKIVDTYVSRIS